jgi:hypothetical protein
VVLDVFNDEPGGDSLADKATLDIGESDDNGVDLSGSNQ